MINTINKVTISQGHKNYYILGRNKHSQKEKNIKQLKKYEFMCSPIESKELKSYSYMFPDNYYIPSTVLYIFEKNYIAREFYDNIATLGEQRFPCFDFINFKVMKNQMILKVKQDIVQRENMQLLECSLESILALSKYLKSNLFIIQKYKYDEYKKLLIIYGTFLPILSKYSDITTQNYISSMSYSWFEED